MNRPLDLGMNFMMPEMGSGMPQVAAIMPPPGSMAGIGAGGFQTAPNMQMNMGSGMGANMGPMGGFGTSMM